MIMPQRNAHTLAHQTFMQVGMQTGCTAQLDQHYGMRLGKMDEWIQNSKFGSRIAFSMHFQGGKKWFFITESSHRVGIPLHCTGLDCILLNIGITETDNGKHLYMSSNMGESIIYESSLILKPWLWMHLLCQNDACPSFWQHNLCCQGY